VTRSSTKIALLKDAYETITAETAKRLPMETGGILVGYREGVNVVVVTHAWLSTGKLPPLQSMFVTMTAQMRFSPSSWQNAQKMIRRAT
jgi:hypothetical protein